jgi:threonine/homoserine/homoserine lactone efflux protein
MEIILKGVITGLLLSVFVGATFFMLIETSISRGFKAALWFDLGVVTCDLAIILTVYFFASWINKTLVNNLAFNIVGGLVFIGFGLNYILRRYRNDTLPRLKIQHMKLFFNGFLINLMNPSVILFWLGTMALTLSKLKLTGKENLVFYAATLGIMVLGDVIKAYFAYRLSHLVNARVMRIIHILSGIIMIGLGIYIFST